MTKFEMLTKFIVIRSSKQLQNIELIQMKV